MLDRDLNDPYALDGSATASPLFAGPAIARNLPDEVDVERQWQALYEEYSRKIFHYAMSILHSREDAEDAVQTTFMNAFGSMVAGTSPRQQAPWLYRIAKNVCLNRIRTLQRKPAATLEGMEVPAIRQLDDQVVENLHMAALRRALERLPEQQRTAFVMRELQGASYNEIATALSTTQGAVESLIFRARRQLATALRHAAPVEPLPHAA